MNRRLQYTGPVYRPPSEAHSLLLQVTVGCSHNSCTFCTMYKDVPFSVDSIEQIERNLKVAASYPMISDRVFLVNGDAFVLSADRLREISTLVQRYLPNIKTISMYASIKNIRNKSDADLLDLAENYLINDLYIGAESGNDEALRILNKGYTKEECIRQINRLTGAGMSIMLSIMPGSLGKNRSLENARDTADLINRTRPKMIWMLTMRVAPDSQLSKLVDNGQFLLSDELENLYEEMELLKHIEVPLDFRGNHVVNSLPLVGMLPEDKPCLIESLENFIKEQGPENLKFTVSISSL